MFQIRRAEERDRSAILGATRDVGVFTSEEVACVDELFQSYINRSPADDYRFIVSADPRGQAVGFACYGAHPLTEGTYDLYWLCTSRQAQGKGVAGALVDHVAQDLRAEHGRLLVAETSSTPEYDQARAFYEHHGFRRWT